MEFVLSKYKVHIFQAVAVPLWNVTQMCAHVTHSPFHTASLIPVEYMYNPRGAPGVFYPHGYPGAVLHCPRPHISWVLIPRGSRTHVSHYDQTPGQPCCIFWLAEVMELEVRKSQYAIRALTFSYL